MRKLFAVLALVLALNGGNLGMVQAASPSSLTPSVSTPTVTPSPVPTPEAPRVDITQNQRNHWDL